MSSTIDTRAQEANCLLTGAVQGARYIEEGKARYLLVPIQTVEQVLTLLGGRETVVKGPQDS